MLVRIRDIDVAFAARPVGLQIQIVKASTSREIDMAFAALVRDWADALLVRGILTVRPSRAALCDY